MPLEKGGRADKYGNRYEIKVIIYEFLKLINEENYSVTIEAIGEDEKGTDILVKLANGNIEHQQCKIRNGSNDSWTISDLKMHDIFKNWKYQLSRDKNRQVSLVSTIGCSFLVDLHSRALNTNNNPRDFYDIQIKSSSKKFQNFYEDICNEMGLSCLNINDISCSIDFLKRIHFNQISEYTLEELINQKIEIYFCSDRDRVFNILLEYIINKDILGHEITGLVLRNYLFSKGIELRSMYEDDRILPKIINLNKEYRKGFKSLDEGLIDRSEFKECIDVIKSEQNLIISGNAGQGKSGCTEAILNYCEKENIPHIAIKLDKRIPKGNCKIWSKELGFSNSIVYKLDSVSKNKQAIIILDQLDALRWTQANSFQALSVCMELIKQVKSINYERKNKMIIVFICREYDLRNDNNIKALFDTNIELNQEKNEWKNVIVRNFDESIVKKILGSEYNKLTKKTKKLLQIPNNLYIWQHLEKQETYDDCVTTNHLIDKWYTQICKNSKEVGVESEYVKKTIDEIVNNIDKMGRLYIPKTILNIEETGFDYLISSEIIIYSGNKVGFVHQSILDHFISKKMINQYYSGENIEDIVGEKNKQTPVKRYQIQMFLQNILEFESNDFLEVCKKILNSDKIRYYIKFIFYEILGQISEPDKNIINFINDSFKYDRFDEYLLDNAIYGNHSYIDILLESGILEKWFLEGGNKKNKVFILLKSINEYLDCKYVNFIEKYIFKNQLDDNNFSDCFLHDIFKDSDELFELRIKFYNKYPILLEHTFAFCFTDKIIVNENIEKRIIRLLSLCLENNINEIYYIEKGINNIKDSFFIENGQYIIDELLKYIPKNNSFDIKYGDWSECINSKKLERTVVELIKKANKQIIITDPELFWSYYEPYMGKNYIVYDEIILYGLKELPTCYSNRVIFYLSNDIDKKIFDYTSGAEDQLGLVKEVIKVHSCYCDDSYLVAFKNMIKKYISPGAVNLYKRRIEHNKSRKYEPIYWSFWGEMQYQLLSNIAYERLSYEDKSLLKVLERKFKGDFNHYSNLRCTTGWVQSPIYGKKIGKNAWLKIITNNKLLNKNGKWENENGTFIERTIESYSRDFILAVREEPETMIRLVLDNKNSVITNWIDYMFSGVSNSENINNISIEILEQMFKSFTCNENEDRAIHFCIIIDQINYFEWSSDIFLQLKDIAINSENDVKNYVIDKEKSECENLKNKALACVSGYAAKAIRSLIIRNNNLFFTFKDTINKLIISDNPIIKMTSIYPLMATYNIDNKWLEEKILYLYESDIRMICFGDAKSIFFKLYSQYRERIFLIIKEAFMSKDTMLVKIGSICICEFYILYDEFEYDIFNLKEYTEEQVNSIIDMAIIYLKYEQYCNKAKKIILRFINLDYDLELSKIFYNNIINLDRDSDFLNEIMKSKINSKIMTAFIYFLEKNTYSIIDYAEFIILLCESILFKDINNDWGIEYNLSKLVIMLYDECCNLENERSKAIAEKCLDLWDIMFEKQIGHIRVLSKELMER